MLETLMVQNVLLIDTLTLDFHGGLTALTGETGAGKSILLDSLGLVLGERAGASFVRPGATQATVTAVFRNIPQSVRKVLEDNGIAFEDETLVLRRVISQDGRSRAFVNDQLLGIGVIKEIAGDLLEIHGQFDRLLQPASHRAFVDKDPSVVPRLAKVREAFGAWDGARGALLQAKEDLARAKAEEEYLTHALAQLDEAAPQEGEEDALLAERATLLQGAKLMDALSQAHSDVMGEGGAMASLMHAQKALAKVTLPDAHPVTRLCEALESILIDLEDKGTTLKEILRASNAGPERLEEVEVRLGLLRTLARKHGVAPSALAGVWAQIEAQVASITKGQAGLDALEREAVATKAHYEEEAERLTKVRVEVAARLTKAVMQELPPLKLEATRFEIEMTREDEAHWGSNGWDTLSFLIQTNPGLPMGPLAKIASGGERSRLLLALKVAFVQNAPVGLMVFDEIDAGVGGAVAHAIGERLARLGATTQVLTVTHAPQVAAQADQHFHVSKRVKSGVTTTHVAVLEGDVRREEIARMLSGDTVEEAARRAADALLAKAS